MRGRPGQPRRSLVRMGLLGEVREHCARVAAAARSVRIELDRPDGFERVAAPALDPERHYLEGPPEAVASYLLTLDSVNFGSGWFPTLRKRPGCSGYFTVAWALADRFRTAGAWSPAQLRGLSAADVAAVLGQDPGHDLMELYGEALRDLGRFLGDRRPVEVVDAAGGSAGAASQG